MCRSFFLRLSGAPTAVPRHANETASEEGKYGARPVFGGKAAVFWCSDLRQSVAPLTSQRTRDLNYGIRGFGVCGKCVPSRSGVQEKLCKGNVTTVLLELPIAAQCHSEMLLHTENASRRIPGLHCPDFRSSRIEAVPPARTRRPHPDVVSLVLYLKSGKCGALSDQNHHCPVFTANGGVCHAAPLPVAGFGCRKCGRSGHDDR